jgi:hypothetical protein
VGKASGKEHVGEADGVGKDGERGGKGKGGWKDEAGWKRRIRRCLRSCACAVAAAVVVGVVVAGALFFAVGVCRCCLFSVLGHIETTLNSTKQSTKAKAAFQHYGKPQ